MSGFNIWVSNSSTPGPVYSSAAGHTCAHSPIISRVKPQAGAGSVFVKGSDWRWALDFSNTTWFVFSKSKIWPFVFLSSSCLSASLHYSPLSDCCLEFLSAFVPRLQSEGCKRIRALTKPQQKKETTISPTCQKKKEVTKGTWPVLEWRILGVTKYCSVVGYIVEVRWAKMTMS